MDIQTAITQIVATAAAVTGIRDSSDKPLEAINVLPFVVGYPLRGTWEISSYGVRKGITTVALEVHVARLTPDLTRATTDVVGYGDTIPNALLSDPTLGSTVNTIVGDITWQFGTLENPSSLATIGYRFLIDIKQETAIT